MVLRVGQIGWGIAAARLAFASCPPVLSLIMPRDELARAPKRGWVGLALVALSVGAMALGSSCSSDDEGGGPKPPPEVPSATVEIEVIFNSDLQKNITDSLHAWALHVKTGAANAEEISCAALVSGEVDPYDVRFERLGDHVSTDIESNVTFETQGVGPALVYVEGVSITGQAELAGCVEADIAEPATDARVTLMRAGVFDCKDSATEDDDPCDDGSFCTVGERCDSGKCSGGAPRDCTALADACNAASCSETDGCETTPVPDGTPCEDGLACTAGDGCQQGACEGIQIDCEAQVQVCEITFGCNEAAGQCIFDDELNGTMCDDGLFCTITDECSFGTCDGLPRDCSLVVLGDDCNVPTCDELNGVCATTFALNNTSCDDTSNECTVNLGLCDGLGACVATPVLDGTLCNGGLGTCQLGVCI